MLESLKEYQSLARDFKAFDASLRIERPSDVAKWLEEVVEWEGKSPVPTPTPYDIPENSEFVDGYDALNNSPSFVELTLSNVKLQLAREEADVALRRSEEAAQDAGPSGFVSLGLEIEEAQ